jgi:hypothetical protein
MDKPDFNTSTLQFYFQNVVHVKIVQSKNLENLEISKHVHEELYLELRQAKA